MDKEQQRTKYANDYSFREHKINAGKEYRARPDIKERSRAYRQKVKDRYNARMRERYATDPLHRRKMLDKAEAKRLNLPISVVRELRSQECFYCGGEGGTIDHLVPQAKGGGNEITNLVPCCKSCNSRKWKRDLVEFYALGYVNG